MDSALNVPVTGMSLSACLEDEDSLLVHIRPGVSVVCHMSSVLITVAGTCREDVCSSCMLPFLRPLSLVAGSVLCAFAVYAVLHAILWTLGI